MKEAIESVAEILTWCISTLHPLSIAFNQQLLITGTGKIFTDFSLTVSIKKISSRERNYLDSCLLPPIHDQ